MNPLIMECTVYDVLFDKIDNHFSIINDGEESKFTCEISDLSRGCRQSGRRRCSGGCGRGRSSWLSSRRHYFCKIKIKMNINAKYTVRIRSRIILLMIFGTTSRCMIDQQYS